MNPSDLFIRRPIMTSLVMLALVVFGAIGYRSLPVSNLPSVDFPTIQVSASLPGANPQNMAASVATPLERQFTTIPGLAAMTSTSSQGGTSITLQFDLDRSIDAAAQDVQTAIAAAGRQLPPGMPTPPTFRKVNPADAPIFYMALSSPTLPLSQVDAYAEDTLAQRISTIKGVAQVSVYGSQKYAVRVQVDPRRLASRGISLDEVATALQRGNTNQPTGTLYGPFKAYSVMANGQLKDAAAYNALGIAYRNGATVHLGELGRVVDSVENNKIAAWFNGVRGVVLAVQRQPGSNTIDVVNGINKQLPMLRRQIPAAVNLNVLYDRSQTIRASVDDVQLTLIATMVLVVVVIFLFLRNLSATIIPSLALPASIIGTFGVMSALHFSLDTLSLMALTLSTGFVVDDAIVMLENIVRRMEGGTNRFQAALAGSREVAFTIVAMTVSLVAVFIPLLFMSGIVGRLFNEFAVTIVVAVLLSGVISITLTPMLASRFLKADDPREGSRFYQALEGGFNWLAGHYETSLRFVLKHRLASLVVAVALAALTGWLYTVVPKGFIPSEDIGQIIVSTEAQQGISFDDMITHQQQLVAIMKQDPNILQFMSSVGSGGRNASGNTGTMFLILKPRHERSLRADQVIEELRPKVSHITGLRVYMQIPPAINIGGQNTRALYQITMQSTDLLSLNRASNDLMDQMRGLPEIQDVNSDVQSTNPQLNVDIDRERASTLGITAEAIESTLANAYGNRQISQIYGDTNEYQVILELDPKFQMDPTQLSLLYVRAANGHLVPLDEVAHMSLGVGPSLVNHFGQLPSATISFNPKPGVALNQATEAVTRLTRVLPDGVSASFKGAAATFEESFKSLGALLILAVVVIYIILGILYESYIHPLTVLSGLPSAGLGALLTLMLFNKPLDIYSFVGLILLIGIVKKNAIMMIDFAIEAEKGERLGAEAAIFQASLVRFRPIMMTSVAALMGALPIALGLGAGGQARQGLGLAVVGGLLVSQTLTLYITPVVYIYLDRFQERLGGGDREPRTGHGLANAPLAPGSSPTPP